MNLNLTTIAKAIKAIQVIDKSNKPYNSVSIDSRKIQNGDLFFALKGSKTDGHLFISEAIKRGARGIVISNKKFIPKENNVDIIIVDDTLKALQNLSKYIRKKSNAKIVTITGSMGKTTTKEFAAKLLSAKFNVLKSEGNLNSTSGLPLSLIKLSEDHQIAVLEMATNKKGEIAQLTKITKPDVAAILNISEVHLEFFGSLKNIAKEKLSVIKHLHKDSTVIFNNDDYLLKDIAYSKKYSYGLENKSDLMIKDAEPIMPYGYKGKFLEKGNTYPFYFPIRGKWNLYNLLAAVSITRNFNVPWDTIIDIIPHLEIPSMRGKLYHLHNDILLIDDSYNSNPRALYEACSDFNNLSVKGRKILILGDMLELGKHSEKLHKIIGEKIAHLNIASVFCIGNLSYLIIKKIKSKSSNKIETFHYEKAEDALDFILNYIKKGDSILIKGSRGIGLDLITNKLISKLKIEDC